MKEIKNVYVVMNHNDLETYFYRLRDAKNWVWKWSLENNIKKQEIKEIFQIYKANIIISQL